MSDNPGILGEIIEQGASIVKQTVKQTAKLPSDLAKTAGSQVTGSDDQKSKEETREFVKSIYGVDQQSNEKPVPPQRDPEKGGTTTESTASNAAAQKELKLNRLRQELHAQYYQRLVNPPKPTEERPAEKVEKEKREEMIDLQEKEKKKPPVLVQRARERVEKYPGASG